MKKRTLSFIFLSLALCLAFPFYACDEEESTISTPQNSQSNSQQTSDENTESGTLPVELKEILATNDENAGLSPATLTKPRSYLFGIIKK